jgi:hypothetical protein
MEECVLMRKVESKEFKVIVVVLAIGTKRLMIVKSVLMGKVAAVETIKLEPDMLQVTVAVSDEQETLPDERY